MRLWNTSRVKDSKRVSFIFKQDTILDLTKSALRKLGYGGTKLVKKCILGLFSSFSD